MTARFTESGLAAPPRLEPFRTDPSRWVRTQRGVSRDLVRPIGGAIGRVVRSVRWAWVTCLPTKTDRIGFVVCLIAAFYIGGFLVPQLAHVPLTARSVVSEARR